MISDSLFSQVLMDPVENGANELLIVSGYATSAMAFHHLEKIQSMGASVNVRLLVGMCSSDGLSLSNHLGFQNIMEETFPDSFKCSYLFDKPPVHSKLYIWRNNGDVVDTFIGSANYTQTAFSNKQREILASISDTEAIDYFHALESQSIFCNHNDTDGLVRIYNDQHYYRRHLHEERVEEITERPSGSEVESATVSLLARNGEVHNVGGLNWGHRDARNRNEAYLQLSPEVYRSDFFPSKGVHFTVVTDDSKTFICTRAQKPEGTAIETPHNNSLLGEFFRNRLGLANGEFVTRQHLEAYGRTTVTFYKFDDENFYLDFGLEK